MKHLFLLISCLIFSQLTQAQIATYKGVVVDSYGVIIPNVFIKNLSGTYAVSSDSNGFFTITLNKDSIQSLYFYRLGFARKEVKTNSLDSFNTIILKQLNAELNAISVTATKHKEHMAKMGKKRNICVCRSIMMYGHELGVFLDARHGNGFLKTVYIYVEDYEHSNPEAYFRINVYENDTFPMTKISKSDFVGHGEKGGGWVKIDVSKDYIPMNGGVYIGVEFLGDWDEGIALGLTNNKKFKRYTYTRNGDGDVVFADDTLQGHHPMIYGEYAYSK